MVLMKTVMMVMMMVVRVVRTMQQAELVLRTPKN